MLNEDQIDMDEFRALRQIEHVDKTNRERFIAFYRKHIDFDQKGTRTCRTCWDRMRARRDDIHQAWDANHERLEAARASTDERLTSAHDAVEAAKAKLEVEVQRALDDFKSDSTKAYYINPKDGSSTKTPE